MTYQIIYTHQYSKKAATFLKKYPNLKNQYQKTLELLEINPSHPSLRLHKLKGNLNLFHSVSINLQYRITMDFIIENKQVILLDVGDHDIIYR